jgi:hypothetical protein
MADRVLAPEKGRLNGVQSPLAGLSKRERRRRVVASGHPGLAALPLPTFCVVTAIAYAYWNEDAPKGEEAASAAFPPRSGVQAGAFSPGIVRGPARSTFFLPPSPARSPSRVFDLRAGEGGEKRRLRARGPVSPAYKAGPGRRLRGGKGPEGPTTTGAVVEDVGKDKASRPGLEHSPPLSGLKEHETDRAYYCPGSRAGVHPPRFPARGTRPRATARKSRCRKILCSLPRGKWRCSVSSLSHYAPASKLH